MIVTVIFLKIGRKFPKWKTRDKKIINKKKYIYAEKEIISFEIPNIFDYIFQLFTFSWWIFVVATHHRYLKARNTVYRSCQRTKLFCVHFICDDTAFKACIISWSTLWGNLYLYIIKNEGFIAMFGKGAIFFHLNDQIPNFCTF